MKIKSFTLLGLAVLALSLPMVCEAKVTGGSSSSLSRSAPTTSQPSTAIKTTTTSVQPSNTNRINSAANTTNTQSSLQINSGAKPVTQPINASYKPQQVNTVRPTTGTLIEQKYVAPNPGNRPVVTQYVTRYNSSGVAFSLPIVIPIGADINSYSNSYNTYFPPNVSMGYRTVAQPVVVDNTPTNGWDFAIFFSVFGGVILIIIIIAFARR